MRRPTTQIPELLEGRVLARSLATTRENPVAAAAAVEAEAAAAAAAEAASIIILVKAGAHVRGTRQVTASGGRTWSLM